MEKRRRSASGTSRVRTERPASRASENTILIALEPSVAAQDRRPAGFQRRLVDVELVRVDRALHHRLAQPVGWR